MIDVRESTDKLKILIVDDSELNRELLAGMLGDEYEIYQVENGKKAIKSVYLIATRDLSNLWLQFFLSQNQGFMRLFEKTVLK